MNGFTFDYLNNYELPVITITTLDKTNEIGILTPSTYKDLTLDLRFNAFSEISLTVNSKTTLNGETIDNPNYEEIKKNNLLCLKDLGWFLINEVTEDIENDVYVKNIECYSYEKILENKSINLTDGTYKFYNALNPSDTDTLMGKIMSALPHWNLGYVDSNLWNKYRTFEIPDASIYSFLMSDVEEAYSCIFDFDTLTNTINVYTSETVVKYTDIMLTFNNLLKKISIEETDSSVVTALGVYGGEDLDIRTVNPLGTSVIYNFEYYYDRMSSDLVSAIKSWQQKITDNIDTYSDLLSDYKDKNSEIITAKSELTDLESELKAIEQVRTAQMPNVLASTSTEYDNKQSEIYSKESLINSLEIEAESIYNQLETIHNELQPTNNFTTSQLLELDNYILEGTYRNENYIQTSIMTSVDVQNMAMELYEQGLEQSKLLSQPTLNLTIESYNFMFLKDFEQFINQLSLGSVINVEYKENQWLQPLLTEMHIEYDEPDNFKLSFANRFRPTSAQWTWAELKQQQDRATSMVNINSTLWSESVKSGFKDEVTNYMTESLNLVNQDIVNNNDSEVIMGEFGIRLREKTGENQYSPIQVWLYNKGMAFTTDNWQTANAFLGTIENPSGGYSTGLIADKIVGKILAGNELIITNENNTFKLDGSGATLTNATFTLDTTSGKNKIILDPTSGFKIQKKDTSWTNIFYIDTDGDLNTKGKITAVGGDIGGFTINEYGIYNNSGNISLDSRGTFTLGDLTMSNGVCRFNGTIYADKISGLIQDYQLAEVYAKYGEFSALKSDVADIDYLVSTKASISSLNALDAEIENLSAKAITTDNLEANLINSKSIISETIDADFVSASGGIMTNGTIRASRLESVGGEFSGSLTASTTHANNILCKTLGCSSIQHYGTGRSLTPITITDNDGSVVVFGYRM